MKKYEDIVKEAKKARPHVDPTKIERAFELIKFLILEEDLGDPDNIESNKYFSEKYGVDLVAIKKLIKKESQH